MTTNNTLDLTSFAKLYNVLAKNNELPSATNLNNGINEINDTSVFVIDKDGKYSLNPDLLSKDSFGDTLSGTGTNKDYLKQLFVAFSALDGEEGLSSEELLCLAALGNDLDIFDGIPTDENGESIYNRVVNENDFKALIEELLKDNDDEEDTKCDTNNFITLINQLINNGVIQNNSNNNNNNTDIKALLTQLFNKNTVQQNNNTIDLKTFITQLLNNKVNQQTCNYNTMPNFQPFKQNSFMPGSLFQSILQPFMQMFQQTNSLYSPMQYQQPQPIYQQPQQVIYQQPQQPIYPQPQPIYQQPIYQQLQTQPIYQQIQTQPIYQRIQTQPIYQQVQTQPIYQQPVQQTYQTVRNIYQQPVQQNYETIENIYQPAPQQCTKPQQITEQVVRYEDSVTTNDNVVTKKTTTPQCNPAPSENCGCQNEITIDIEESNGNCSDNCYCVTPERYDRAWDAYSEVTDCNQRDALAAGPGGGAVALSDYISNHGLFTGDDNYCSFEKDPCECDISNWGETTNTEDYNDLGNGRASHGYDDYVFDGAQYEAPLDPGCDYDIEEVIG